MRPFLLVFLTACYDRCRTTEAVIDDSCLLQSEGYGPAGEVAITAEVVASGLEVPWSLQFLPSGKLLVAERAGRVRVIGGNVVATPKVRTGSEQGLLGMALHPDFQSNHWFYIYFTAEEENRVERWRLADDEASAVFDRNIVGGIARSNNHDGGRLRFGPDGLLYLSAGDAQSPERAQLATGLNGRILRVNDDGTGLESVVIGVRNSEGFDWLDDGRMVIADHGPSGENGKRGLDEISIASVGDNLGWPSASGCSGPIMVWVDAMPPGGLTIYRGGSISEWEGNIMVASLGAQHLHRIVLSGDKVGSHETYLLNAHGRLRDAVLGPANELYVTTSNCDGRGTCPAEKDKILKITRSSR